jgi:gliding motility-associated lipoprotein GldH
MKNYLLWLSQALLLLQIGCENHAYQFEHTFPQHQWKIGDTLVYSYDNLKENTPLCLAIEGKYTADYPFQNIYLRTFFTSSSTTKDTLVLDTLSDKMGKWRGDIRSIPFQDTLHLLATHKGIVTLKVIQYMRKDTLIGIESLRMNLFPAP